MDPNFNYGYPLSQQDSNVPASRRTKLTTFICSALTVLGIAFLWFASFFLDSLGGDGSAAFMIVIILIPCSLFIIVSNIIAIASVRKLSTNYGLSITPIVFASLVVIACLVSGIIFSLVTSTFYSYVQDVCYDQNSVCLTFYRGYFIGFLFISLGSFIVSLSQIGIIVVSASEIKRASKSTSRVIVVSNNYQPLNYPPQLMQMNPTNSQFVQLDSQPQYINQTPQLAPQPEP